MSEELGFLVGNARNPHVLVYDIPVLVYDIPDIPGIPLSNFKPLISLNGMLQQ